MTKFIRLKALVIADDKTVTTLDYNVNTSHLIGFGDVVPDVNLPEDFKGSIVIIADGARTLVAETPRKIRSLIAESEQETTISVSGSED